METVNWEQSPKGIGEVMVVNEMVQKGHVDKRRCKGLRENEKSGRSD